jgi:N,N'-diacetyllegionaminate synthase
MGTGNSNGRAEIIAELATAHGGDLVLACEMIHAAAEAGADTVKLQTYSLARLNPADPQAEWLRKAHLSQESHQVLIECCKDAKVQFLSTPFDPESLTMLRELGLHRFKIASSESANDWWEPRPGETWLISWPWGVVKRLEPDGRYACWGLTAIPLYPTPLECVGQAKLLAGGWSDHCEGTAACLYAVARGAKIIEAHFTIPGARQKTWDKSPAQLKEIRQFAEACATMTTGVSEVFRTRWSA